MKAPSPCHSELQAARAAGRGVAVLRKVGGVLWLGFVGNLEKLRYDTNHTLGLQRGRWLVDILSEWRV